MPKNRGSFYNEMMSKSCLRWFNHVRRKVTNVPIRKSEFIQIEGRKKGRGIPKITLIKAIRKNMPIKGVIKNMTLDIVEWKQRI